VFIVYRQQNAGEYRSVKTADMSCDCGEVEMCGNATNRYKLRA